MTRPMTFALTAMMAFAPMDAARAGGAQPVMEIVTYKLKPDTDIAAYMDAARATETFLQSTGAVIRRALTVDADGIWTDVIEWRSLSQAKAAEAEAMQRPEFGIFFSSIDDSTVSLRHADIVWRMD